MTTSRAFPKSHSARAFHPSETRHSARDTSGLRDAARRLSRATIAFALAMIVYMGNGRTPGWATARRRAICRSASSAKAISISTSFPKCTAWSATTGEARPRLVGVVLSDRRRTRRGPVLRARGALRQAFRRDGDACRRMEKLSAAAMVALSVAFLYAALLARTSPRMAALLAVAYALGTSSASVSSQALCSTGPRSSASRSPSFSSSKVETGDRGSSSPPVSLSRSRSSAGRRT